MNCCAKVQIGAWCDAEDLALATARRIGVAREERRALDAAALRRARARHIVGVRSAKIVRFNAHRAFAALIAARHNGARVVLAHIVATATVHVTQRRVNHKHTIIIVTTKHRFWTWRANMRTTKSNNWQKQ